MGGAQGGGIDASAAPAATYSGKWSGWHVEDYDGAAYWEAVFYTSGTLTVTGTIQADAWGIGGGGGCNMAQGGGSGYTNMALGLSLKETQRLLAVGGCGALYPRVRRDAAVIFALNQKMSLLQAEELLSSLPERSLFARES